MLKALLGRRLRNAVKVHHASPHLEVTTLFRSNPLQDSIPTMNKRSLLKHLESVAICTTAFLATYYFWYKQESKYMVSDVWSRMLGKNDDQVDVDKQVKH